MGKKGKQKPPPSPSAPPSHSPFQPLPSPSAPPSHSPFQPLPSPRSSPSQPPFQENANKKKPSSSSPSFSPKLIFASGIVLGIVVAMALAMLFLNRKVETGATNAVDLQQMKENIAQIREQGKSKNDLFEAVAFYENALAAKSGLEFSTLEFAALLDEAGDVMHRARRFADAEKAHRRALEIKAQHAKEVSPNELIFSYVALATDLYKGGKIEEALNYVHKAEGPTFSHLGPPVHALLHRLESSIHECNGDFISALHRFEHSLKLSPISTHAQDRQLELLHMHRDLLRKARMYHAMPARVASAMESKEKEVEAKLMSMGPWTSPLQLPKVYMPKLTSKPWHNISDYPQLQKAYDIVKKAYSALRDEYYQLAAKSLLTQEGECIHDTNRGKWAIHDITSFWVPKDERGCSKVAPSGCSLFQELKAVGFPVIRGGYSALSPGAWLRPHFGVTNGQLKFHLGLVVPKKEMPNKESERCAFMRVGNEIRGWEEKEITFFDDSYEHEVWNNCTSDRVVFQVVFVHPDLPSSATREELFALPSH